MQVETRFGCCEVVVARSCLCMRQKASEVAISLRKGGILVDDGSDSGREQVNVVEEGKELRGIVAEALRDSHRVFEVRFDSICKVGTCTEETKHFNSRHLHQILILSCIVAQTGQIVPSLHENVGIDFGEICVVLRLGTDPFSPLQVVLQKLIQVLDD